MNEEILNRLASLETKISALEAKIMKLTTTSNPGVLHEEVVKFLQTFGSELNRMYGAYGPNQMAMNIQPRFMYQPPMYNPMPGFNPSVHSAGHAMKPNGFENYQMNTNSGLAQPTFTPFCGTSNTYQQTENIDNEAQEQHEKLNNDEKSQDDVSETVFAGTEHTGSVMSREEWLNRLQEVGISPEPAHAPDFVFKHLVLGAYKNLVVRSNVYPNKVLQPGYAWYPGTLIHKDNNAYRWYITKLVD